MSKDIASRSCPAATASPAATEALPSAAFTPGPWKHSGDGAPPIERDPRVWVYAPDHIGNHLRIATAEAVMRDGDLCAINLANARLIAAAPELYEALKELCAEDGNAIRGMALGVAALAKVDGR